MKNAKRREMLRTLASAREACRSDHYLTGLGFQIDVAIDYLILLVAGERKCSKYDVATPGPRLCSPKMPLIDRLNAIEEAVRDVYADFEAALAKEKYEDGPALTLGDRMVLDAVDDTVWTITGMHDELKEEEKVDGHEGSEA